MGRHSVEDERVFWRSFGLTLLKWVGVATLPVLAAFGIWRLVSSEDSEPEPPKPSAVAVVSPSPTLPSPSPEAVLPSPTPPASPSPTATKGELQVLNGSGVAGTGVQAAERLKAAGYTVVATQNASRRYDKTTIFYQPGFKQMAEGVAKTLGIGTVQPALENLDKQIPVTAVIGADYKA